VFDEDKDNPDKILYKVKLSDIETRKVFYDRLSFYYLEMPKFKKSLSECKNHFERWLYVLRNLEQFDRYPANLQEKIFKKLFGVAEVANLTPGQLDEYDESLKVYRDLKGCLDTAFDDGFNQALNELNPKLEEEKQRAEKADKRAKKADKRAEEEKQRAEDIMQKAIQALMDQGNTEAEAKKMLGL
jgi:hypothetical protein